MINHCGACPESQKLPLDLDYQYTHDRMPDKKQRNSTLFSYNWSEQCSDVVRQSDLINSWDHYGGRIRHHKQLFLHARTNWTLPIKFTLNISFCSCYFSSSGILHTRIQEHSLHCLHCIHQFIMRHHPIRNRFEGIFIILFSAYLREADPKGVITKKIHEKIAE